MNTALSVGMQVVTHARSGDPGRGAAWQCSASLAAAVLKVLAPFADILHVRLQAPIAVRSLTRDERTEDPTGRG